MSTRCKYYIRKLPILARQSLCLQHFDKHTLANLKLGLFYACGSDVLCVAHPTAVLLLFSSCSCNCVTWNWATLSCRLIHFWDLYGNFCNPDNAACTKSQSMKGLLLLLYMCNLFVQRVVMYYVPAYVPYRFPTMATLPSWLVNQATLLSRNGFDTWHKMATAWKASHHPYWLISYMEE